MHVNLSILSALLLPADGGEGGEFDLIGGVPAHPLLVHFAVVLLPLSALGLLVILFVPKLRRSLGWLVMLGLAAAAGASLLAKETGEALAELVGLPERHADLGDKLPVFAALLFIVALAWYLLAQNADRRMAKATAAAATTTTSVATASASESASTSTAPAPTGGRSPLTLVLGAIAGLLALLNIYWVIQVGHSGAEAVWAGRLPASGSAAAAPSTAPSDSASASASASSSSGTITMADVAKHNSQADCWSVVNKDVYNLTAWIAQHPGGPSPIESMCGVDATSAFTNQHGGQGRPEQELASFKIGVLG